MTHSILEVPGVVREMSLSVKERDLLTIIGKYEFHMSNGEL